MLPRFCLLSNPQQTRFLYPGLLQCHFRFDVWDCAALGVYQLVLKNAQELSEHLTLRWIRPRTPQKSVDPRVPIPIPDLHYLFPSLTPRSLPQAARRHFVAPVTRNEIQGERRPTVPAPSRISITAHSLTSDLSPRSRKLYLHYCGDSSPYDRAPGRSWLYDHHRRPTLPVSYRRRPKPLSRSSGSSPPQNSAQSSCFRVESESHRRPRVIIYC